MTNQRAYHHGDLRRAVIAAALDVIAAEGPSALSLRDLARRAGVSHAAPAHHFGDRTGLLTAIATEGHILLAGELAESSDLRDMGAHYIRFATRHPAHFQVMFRPDLVRSDDLELVAARSLTAERLAGGVAALGGPDPQLAFTAAWSMAHGFATLLLTGSLDAVIGGRDPEDVFRAAAATPLAPPRP
ncbi:TetR/AcrR family transcriptional regulator [Peterkaempfera sp. SMS 1(5)a]|uniref:TetR/AcrR family transcriptional regulator n=1 Tax=Peterkaempfera podocarpi TaxID=3232308 RepID=UPI003670970F